MSLWLTKKDKANNWKIQNICSPASWYVVWHHDSIFNPTQLIKPTLLLAKLQGQSKTIMGVYSHLTHKCKRKFTFSVVLLMKVEHSLVSMCEKEWEKMWDRPKKKSKGLFWKPNLGFFLIKNKSLKSNASGWKTAKPHGGYIQAHIVQVFVSPFAYKKQVLFPVTSFPCEVTV